MNFSRDQIAEIEILVRYNLETTQQGIKVHSTAGEEHVEAVKRLFEKGLVTQVDGGYLTDLGRSAAEHAQALILMLAPHYQSPASSLSARTHLLNSLPLRDHDFLLIRFITEPVLINISREVHRQT